MKAETITKRKCLQRASKYAEMAGSARRNVLHRAIKYVKYAKNGCVDRLIKGKPL